MSLCKNLKHKTQRTEMCVNAQHITPSPRVRSLYQAMNGKTLEEMDTILYPVCALCREHELSGFITGIKLALRLVQELRE